MTTIHEQKSSVDEIRHRFDNDVDRFSNIETGQTAKIDATLAMELTANNTLFGDGSILITPKPYVSDLN